MLEKVKRLFSANSGRKGIGKEDAGQIEEIERISRLYSAVGRPSSRNMDRAPAPSDPAPKSPRQYHHHRGYSRHSRTASDADSGLASPSAGPMAAGIGATLNVQEISLSFSRLKDDDDDGSPMTDGIVSTGETTFFPPGGRGGGSTFFQHRSTADPNGTWAGVVDYGANEYSQVL